MSDDKETLTDHEQANIDARRRFLKGAAALVGLGATAGTLVGAKTARAGKPPKNKEVTVREVLKATLGHEVSPEEIANMPMSRVDELYARYKKSRQRDERDRGRDRRRDPVRVEVDLVPAL
ncbi:MAG: hypothetical protein K1X71_12930 [Pirellulales bacterium]|nr:hypothetical protein [Pirellulales bacterium]